jgi:hypothetical protein
MKKIIVDIMKEQKKSIILLSIIFLMSWYSVNAYIVNDFKAENGDEWNVKLDPLGYISYAERPKPTEIGNKKTKEEVISIAENFLSKNKNFFRVGSFSYNFAEFKTIGSDDVWIVDYITRTLPIFLGVEPGTPPDIYIRIFMTPDGQVYRVGDIDMVGGQSGYDQPINENVANDIAKDVASVNGNPQQSNLIGFMPKDGTEEIPVWNITFGPPDNKEVLIDAFKGEVISVKSIEKKENQTIELSANYSKIIILIVVVLIGVSIFIIERRRHKTKPITTNQ